MIARGVGDTASFKKMNIFQMNILDLKKWILFLMIIVDFKKDEYLFWMNILDF